jgi:hypothetical protein
MSLEAHHRFILDTMQRNQDIARNIINELEAENARLKAEVELLREAGDEVVSRIQVCTEDLWCSIHRWNAAKEGKGQP